MAVRLSLLLGFTLAVLHGAASAQQQAFSRETRQLHYVWQYEDAATQAFTLRLPDSQILPVWTTCSTTWASTTKSKNPQPGPLRGTPEP